MADATDWDDDFLILQSGDDPIAAHTGSARENSAEPRDDDQPYSAVDAAPAPRFRDEDSDCVIFDLTYDPGVADAVFPEFAELRLCVDWSDALVEESKYTFPDHAIELLEIPCRRGRKFNFPFHGV
jgi:hypothetical protein